MYEKMSNMAYSDLKEGGKVKDIPGWEVLESTRSHRTSGFDAVTFYNPETKQAVIAYRGTEGSASLDRSVPDFVTDATIGIPELKRKVDQTIDQKIDFTPDWWDAGVQKVKDKTGITAVNDWVGEREKDLDKITVFGKNNQMYLAEDYAKEMQSKHEDLDFSLTGHSLGGGNAQYASVYTGMPAVTFSAPSVIENLTPGAKRKAEEGEYDSQITNYAHPGDVVASGAMGGYDRHVGTTYYIDSNYADANKDVSIIDKAKNSFGGPNYHSLDQYKFNKDGYISNELYDPVTGKRVEDSPRMPGTFGLVDDLQDMAHRFGSGVGAFIGGLSQLAAAAAASGSGKIQVTPEELREVAGRWKQNAQQSSSELSRVRQQMQQYLHTSQSRRLAPIVTQLDASISELSQWHLQRTSEFLQFISSKADQFQQADNTY
ncbi:hypothetical protein [Paenibacillus lacisoli]